MLPGARAIPLTTLTGSLTTLDRTTPVVVYCASGHRSLIAASVLVANGFDDVADLAGGWDAWSGDGAEGVRRGPGNAH
jgi:rhodanese-related sulfurtransferase